MIEQVRPNRHNPSKRTSGRKHSQSSRTGTSIARYLTSSYARSFEATSYSDIVLSERRNAGTEKFIITASLKPDTSSDAVSGPNQTARLTTCLVVRRENQTERLTTCLVVLLANQTVRLTTRLVVRRENQTVRLTTRLVARRANQTVRLTPRLVCFTQLDGLPHDMSASNQTERLMPCLVVRRENQTARLTPCLVWLRWTRGKARRNGWGTGIRTPIAGTKNQSPAIGRYPSVNRASDKEARLRTT